MSAWHMIVAIRLRLPPCQRELFCSGRRLGRLEHEGVEGIIRDLAMFRRVFANCSGRQRIALAKSLLRDDHMSLAEVALACGFSDQSHFTRCFSASVGMSPGMWRQSVRQ
jgi:hypothetical protein